MAEWQNQLYKDYIAGRLSAQGRTAYEADVMSGVIQAPQGAQLPFAQQAAQPQKPVQQQSPIERTAQPYIDAGMRQAEQPPPAMTEGIPAAFQKETTPYQVPDDVLQRFWNGDMSDDGMKNLINDLRDGVVTTPETEDVSIWGELKDSITGEKRRVAETEKLESWFKMPELWQLSPEALMTHIGTMAAGPDEIATIMKKQHGVPVAQDSKGNYVFTSNIDGKQYAVKPGFRDEDIPRAVATTLLIGLGSRGKTPLRRVGGAAATQAGIEASQEATGGRFDALEVPAAALFEGGGTLVGKGVAALKGYLKSAPKGVQNAFKKAGIKLPGQTTTELERGVRAAETAGVTPLTSDVFPPETPTAKAVQVATERIPVIGTGTTRVAQQKTREEAVKDVLRDYGADELAQASDDVMKDLLKKRGADITKYTKQKGDIIERLSKEADATDYGMQHRPSESGGTLDDITAGGELMPDDVYTNPEYYADMSDVSYQQSVNAIKKAKGKPESTVTLYRASPKDELRNGDWVTLSKRYAMQEAKREGVPVNEFKVKAKDVQFAGDDLNEFGYWGKGINTKPTNTVPINKTTAAIDKEVARLQALNNKDVEPLIEALENSRASFTDQPLSGIEDNRKLLGETLDDAGFEKVKSQASKVKQKIYNAVNGDMGDYIKENGKPRDFDKWKVANKRLQGSVKDLDISALRSVIKNGKSTPEDVKKLLFSRKPSDIKRLYKSLSPEGKKRARVAVWQQAAEKATTKDGFSTAKFATELNKLGKTTGVFFKGKDKETLDGIAKILKMTNRAEVAGVMPPTGVQNYHLIATSMLGGGYLAGGIGVPATAATIAGVARAYESKPVRNILIKIAKGEGSEQKLIKQLVDLLKTKRQFTKKSVSPAEQRRALEIIAEEA